MLQWNASIMDHLYVSDVMLMEHAHAGPKSVLAQSLLGPDVRVLAGEVHASVIGPNKINL
jgi:NDP-sugar pyrophosphorylase family protein